MKKLLFIIAILTELVNQHGFTQNAKIEVEFPAFKDSTVLLGYYIDGKVFVKDTLQPAGNALFRYESTENLKQGIYAIVGGKTKQVDFLLGKEQTVTIAINGNNYSVKGNDESLQFYNYQLHLKEQQKKRLNLTRHYQKYKTNKDSLTLYRSKLKVLNGDMNSYWKEHANKYKGSFFGTFMASMIPVDLPAEAFKDVPTQKRWQAEYNYRKDHYFDHFDLTDARLINTPTIKGKFELYFNKVLLQIPDTILNESIRLIEKAKPDPEMYKYVASFALNNSLTSKYMGMEDVFVKLAQKYYLSGDASWADSTLLSKLMEEVIKRKPTLIGNKAPDFKMQSIDEEWFSLHNIDSPYTLVVFWETDCGHCKKEIPNLYNSIFLPFRDKGLKVLAVYTHDNKEEWEKFVMEKGIEEWINLYDPDNQTNFRLNYNIVTTPAIFLLDKDKKIIAKKLGIDAIKNILESKI